MSRTIRRKSGKEPRWVRTTWSWPFGGRIKMEGKELQKSLVKYHSDWGYGRNSPSKWFRSREEATFRSQNKVQLARFYKDFEYEVIMKSKYKMPYWD